MCDNNYEDIVFCTSFSIGVISDPDILIVCFEKMTFSAVFVSHTHDKKEREIYFKELAHAIMKTDKPKICIEQIGRLKIQGRGHVEV